MFALIIRLAFLAFYVNVIGFGTKGVSSNRKIGPVLATYRPIGTEWTCPAACVMVRRDGSVCYADQHHVGMHQIRSRELTFDLLAWIVAVPANGAFLRGIRHLVSGDLFRRGAPDFAYIDAMVAGHIARPDTYGWGYTHGWRELPVARVNGAPNCVINASCETPDDIRQAHKLGWPAVTIVAPDTAPGLARFADYSVLTCPQQTGRASCDSCRMCAYGPNDVRRTDRRTGRPIVIGFRAHGAINRVADAIGAAWRTVSRQG